MDKTPRASSLKDTLVSGSSQDPHARNDIVSIYREPALCLNPGIEGRVDVDQPPGEFMVPRKPCYVAIGQLCFFCVHIHMCSVVLTGRKK